MKRNILRKRIVGATTERRDARVRWRSRALATLVPLLLALPAVAQPSNAASAREEQWQVVLDEMAGAGIVRHADLPYATMEGVEPERLVLDVYSRAGLEKAPVVLFVHGGGWQRGDKRAVWRKPLALVPAGYVVVASHYRFRPQVEVTEQAADVARAVAWVHGHIAEHGGDPERIVLMGHSAGAHLVALVGTRSAFLEAEGLSLEALAGVVPLDTGPYDVPLQLERTAAGTRYGDLMRFVFGDDPSRWTEVSPRHHVEKGAGIPPFLVFHHDGRRDVPLQAAPFVEALQEAGVEAELVNAEGKTHGSLNTDLGLPGEAPTEKLFEFLGEVAPLP